MRKKYLVLICLLYAFIILYVYLNNILKNFLAPRMHIYLLLAMFILVIMSFIIFFSDCFHYNFKVLDLILLLPLLMIITAQDGKLSIESSNNRISTFKPKKIVKVKIKKVDNKTDNSKLNFDNPDFVVEDENYIDLVNYLSSNENAKNYVGKTIKVKGFTVGNNNYLPNGLYELGKYLVTCCAADSSFKGFILNSNNHIIEGSTWYEVEGYLDISKDFKGKDIIVITVVNIKEIDEKSEDEYIYPCYEYGDRNCEKTKKYNLKY